ncbi:uncharacterized protein [Arachis hypogaea]|uniref:uncharacterized protein n=1 Tax=Arachis hypogaea TaxID=3818 RepID=UPI003B218BFC
MAASNNSATAAHSAQTIWNGLKSHFASQVKAKVIQLRNKLNGTKISAVVNDYVLTIKSTIDELTLVGEKVSKIEHVNATLHGLTEDYALYKDDNAQISYSQPQYRERYENRQQQAQQPEANLRNVLANPATIQESIWYPDSGATHHITADPENVTEKQNYEGKDQVVVENGIVFFEFHSHGCYIKSQDTEEVILQGDVARGMYRLLNLRPEHSPSALISSNEADTNKYMLWHARIGHASATVVSKVLKSYLEVVLPWASTSTSLKPHDAAINSHPMVTGSKTGSLKPKAFHVSVEPRNVHQALADPKWKEAMDAEFEALQMNKTWKLVSLPAGRKAI